MFRGINSVFMKIKKFVFLFKIERVTYKYSHHSSTWQSIFHLYRLTYKNALHDIIFVDVFI